jgi:AraC-like DNA-binding protein
MFASPQRESTTSIRILLCYLRAAEAQGADPERILRESGLSRARLEAPDDRISTEQFYMVVRTALEYADDTLGLVAGTRVQDSDLGLLRFIVSTGDTMRAATQAADRYMGLLADGLRMSIIDQGEHCLVSYALDWQRMVAQRMSLLSVSQAMADPTSVAITDMLLATTYTALGRELEVDIEAARAAGFPLMSADAHNARGARLKPLELWLSHPRTDHVDSYERLFECPVRFSAEETGFLFPSAALDLPLVHRDRRMHALFSEQAEQLLSALQTTPSWSARVRHAVGELLERGNPTIDDVARGLAVSRSTLKRRLAEEGSHFKELVDELRAQLARRHLRESSLTTTEIAYLLGFSDVAAFHRAFRRWHDENPGDYRRRSHSGAQV